MTAEQFSALLGAFLPILIGVLLQANWAKWVKRLVVIAVSFVIGLIVTAIADGIKVDTIDNIIQTIFVVIGAAQVAYVTFFKPTGLAENIEKNINLPLLR